MIEENKQTMNSLAKTINDINRANGWEVLTPEDWKNEERILTVIALIHSEISEVLEAFRHNDKENFVEELADVVIRCLDCLGGLELEINGLEFDADFGPPDIDWNSPREIPAILARHHLILSRALLSFYDDNIIFFNSYLLSEIDNVIYLAFDSDVDLKTAIIKKLEKNKARGYKHGGKKV